MIPERWREVERLYHAALEVEKSERAAFLEAACRGDEGLRREVESLLEYEDRATDFIEKPAVEVAAEMLTEALAADGAAQQAIDRYLVRAKLGSGGMGEVYLAWDTKLERRVALKVLPPEFTSDQQRMRRFEQEARAASRLSHPNVAQIYELGDAKGRPYIAMEYVEGRTLRDRLAAGRMSVGEALDISIQAASALAAAHGVGVVHRDVKPENVIVTPDGTAKVLDFGLAKLAPHGPASSSAPTLLHTESGMRMGTAHYMSPEQARGLEVDARTDVWSLGVVLYEMVTGRPPFDGETASDVIASILGREPAAVTRITPGVPDELERIIKKCLAKKQAERFQLVGHLLAGLRSLKQLLDGQGGRTNAGRAVRTARATARDARSGADSLPSASASTKSHEPRLMFTAGHTLDRVKDHRGGILLLGFLLATATGAAAYMMFGKDLVLSTRSAQAPPVNVSKLTSLGAVTQTAISPDGKSFVYVLDDSGRQGLWHRRLSAVTSVPVVAPDEVTYHGVTFSPDGDHVYYVTQTANSNSNVLYRVPSLGGFSQQLTVDIDTPVTLSPDGGRYAFGRGYPDRGEFALIVANADGQEERVVAVHKSADQFCSGGGPAWSPGADIIACSRRVADASGEHAGVVTIRLSDGTEEFISSAVRWTDIMSLAWLKDGDGLVAVAMDEESPRPQVFRLSDTGGEARRLTTDVGSYARLSLAPDVGAAVAVRTDRTSNIWTAAPGGMMGEVQQVSSGTGDYYSVAWTPDGKILSSVVVNGSSDLWRMEPDGVNATQLTFDPHLDSEAVASPDGKLIAYVSRRDGIDNIWTMNADGTGARRLTGGKGDYSPQWTPDGKWVFYFSYDSGKASVWKVPAGGGDPSPVTDRLSKYPVVSPDGKMIACQYLDEETGPVWKTAIISASGGPPVKLLNIPTHPWQVVQWTRDGRALTYTDTERGAFNVWAQPLSGGRPERLTNFAGGQIFFYDWSRDGGRLVILRGNETSDVVLLEGLR